MLLLVGNEAADHPHHHNHNHHHKHPPTKHPAPAPSPSPTSPALLPSSSSSSWQRPAVQSAPPFLPKGGLLAALKRSMTLPVASQSTSPTGTTGTTGTNGPNSPYGPYGSAPSPSPKTGRSSDSARPSLVPAAPLNGPPPPTRALPDKNAHSHFNSTPMVQRPSPPGPGPAAAAAAVASASASTSASASASASVSASPIPPTHQSAPSIGQIYHSVFKRQQKAHRIGANKVQDVSRAALLHSQQAVDRIYKENKLGRKRKWQEMDREAEDVAARLKRTSSKGPSTIFIQNVETAPSRLGLSPRVNGIIGNSITESPQHDDDHCDDDHDHDHDYHDNDDKAQEPSVWAGTLPQSHYPFLAENEERHQKLRSSVVSYLVQRHKRLREHEHALRNQRIAHERAWFSRLKAADKKLRDLVVQEHFGANPSPSPLTSPIIGTGSSGNIGAWSNAPPVQSEGHVAGKGKGVGAKVPSSRDATAPPIKGGSSAATSPSPANGVYSRRRGAATASDVVRTEAEFIEVMERLEQEASRQSNAVHPFPGRPPIEELVADVPDMQLDPFDLYPAKYQETNRRIHDPAALLRNSQPHWTASETRIFVEKFQESPKNFGRIASFLPGKTEGQIVHFYYARKHELGLASSSKKALKESVVTNAGPRKKMLGGKKRSLEDLKNPKSPVIATGTNSSTASPRPESERKRRPSRRKEKDEDSKVVTPNPKEEDAKESKAQSRKETLKVDTKENGKDDSEVNGKQARSPVPTCAMPANNAHSKDTVTSPKVASPTAQSSSSKSNSSYRKPRRSHSISGKDALSHTAKSNVNPPQLLHPSTCGVALPPIPLRIPAGIPPPPALMSAPVVAAAAAAATGSKGPPIYAMPLHAALPPQIPIGVPPITHPPAAKIDTSVSSSQGGSKSASSKGYAAVVSPKADKMHVNHHLSAPVLPHPGVTSPVTTHAPRSAHPQPSSSSKKSRKHSHSQAHVHGAAPHSARGSHATMPDLQAFPGAIAAAPVPVSAIPRSQEKYDIGAVVDSGAIPAGLASSFSGRPVNGPQPALAKAEDLSVRKSAPNTPQSRHQSVAVTEIAPLRTTHVHQPGTPRDLRVLKSPRRAPATLSPKLTVKTTQPPVGTPPQMIVTIPVPVGANLNSSVIAVSKSPVSKAGKVSSSQRTPKPKFTQPTSPLHSPLAPQCRPAPVPPMPRSAPAYEASRSQGHVASSPVPPFEGPSSAVVEGHPSNRKPGSDFPQLHAFQQPETGGEFISQHLPLNCNQKQSLTASSVSTAANETVIKVVPQRKVSSIGSLLNDTPPSSDSSTTEEEEALPPPPEHPPRRANGDVPPASAPVRVILNPPAPPPGVNIPRSPQRAVSMSQRPDVKPQKSAPAVIEQSIYDELPTESRRTSRERHHWAPPPPPPPSSMIPPGYPFHGPPHSVSMMPAPPPYMRPPTHGPIAALGPMPALFSAPIDHSRRHSDIPPMPPPPMPPGGLPPISTYLGKPVPPTPRMVYPMGGFFEEGGVVVGMNDSHSNAMAHRGSASSLSSEALSHSAHSAASEGTNGRMKVSELVSWSNVDENSDTE